MTCKSSYKKISEENWLLSLKAANESGCREPKLRPSAINGKLRSDDRGSHRSVFLKLCLLHLENLLGWDTNRPSSLSNYPYQETKIDEWFVQSFTNEEQQKSVNIINVSKAGKRNKIYEIQFGIQGFPMSLEDDDFEVFLHGTNAKSAQSIIEEGIRNEGGLMQDFSRGNGFYVCKDLDVALRRAGEKYSQDARAVITFQVNKSELRDPDKFKGFDLQTDKKEWQMNVKQFRSRNPKSKFFNDFKRNKFDYCEGPMATTSRGYPKQRDGSYQLCVYFKGKCTELFNNSLHSVLFFERVKKKRRNS